MRKSFNFVASVALLATASVLSAQTITSVTPEAAAPGDTIVIRGANLAAVTQVRFEAVVGGFVGISNVLVTASSVSATEVVATVPLINSFTPPNAVPPGSPLGNIRVRTGTGVLSNQRQFFFMEATFGQVTTTGNGTTQSNGRRAITSFTYSGGAPTPGNAAFVLTLDNAIPSSAAIVAFGLEGVPPYPLVSDGTVVIDIFQPYQVLPQTFVTDALGRATLPAPIPNVSLGLSIAVQWAMVDGVSGAVEVAEALVVQL